MRKRTRQKELHEDGIRASQVYDPATRIREPLPPREPEIGETRVFVPSYMTDINVGGYSLIRHQQTGPVRGAIVYVNRPHRWIRCRYLRPNGDEAFECFKY